jgi:hypothetical protein
MPVGKILDICSIDRFLVRMGGIANIFLSEVKKLRATIDIIKTEKALILWLKN